MPAPGEHAQAHGQFLHDIKNRHQQNLQQQQPIAPLHTTLAGGDHAADIGIRKHHDDAGPKYRHEPAQPRPKAAFGILQGDVHEIANHSQLMVWF